MKKCRSAVCALCFLTVAPLFGAESAWMDATKSPEERAKLLVAEMTLEEKADELQMHFMGAEGAFEALTNRLANGRTYGTILKTTGARQAHDLQRRGRTASRLHIPFLYTEDVTHGFRTILPVGLGSASTWNESLVEASEEMAAREAVTAGFHLTYAPMCDISDDPRWGRICETSGEDPYLSARLTAARIRGFHKHFAACIKHFAGYGGLRAGRDYHPSDYSRRELEETYLKPYFAAVREGVDQVMCAYTPFDADNCTLNRFLNIDVLRGRLGFEGPLITDWATINSCVRLGVAKDRFEASEKAMAAGIDGDMVSRAYGDCLPTLAREGRVAERRLDEACVRSLALKFKLGLFDNPFRYGDEKAEVTNQFTAANRALAREVVRQGAILLENNHGILPLSTETKIAVVGPLADLSKDQLGDWPCFGRENETVTLLAGLKEAWGKNLVSSDEAETIVYCAGERVKWGGEHKSRMNPVIPEEQVREIRQLKAKGKKVVVIVLSARPLVLTEIKNVADAILFAFFPGTEGGHGIADLLSGAANPSGHLVQTFPHSIGQIPLSYRERRPWMYDEWVDGSTKPLYPFGYGLSYTTFSVSQPVWTNGMVEVEVKNTGNRDGACVVQLYLRHEQSSVVQRERELKGFRRVELHPRGFVRVAFPLVEEDFRILNAAHEWVDEKKPVTAFVGFDSTTTNGVRICREEKPFPFVISYDGGEEGSVTDFSGLLEAPAGKHGFVRADGERFVTDKGEIRFFGVNMTGPANFPTHEDADATAARLARLGVNCVRLHFLDVWYAAMFDEPQQCLLAKTNTCRELSAAQFDRLDYFIAALKKKGIYVNINLHVGRVPGKDDGCPEGCPKYAKGVQIFHPRLRELFKEYCRDLLTHVNPYTETAYGREPSVAFLEIDNEQSAFLYAMRGDYEKSGQGWKDEFKRQWNVWRAKNLSATDTQPIPDRLTAPKGVWYNFYRFLIDLDAEYYRDMYAFLKNELGVRCAVTGSQAHYSTAFNQMELDYVDEHAYWRHPTDISGKPSKPNKWWVGADSMVNSLQKAFGMANQRVFGKPYVISEYNHPTPNPYGAEGMPMIATMAALQGWNGVYHYTYNHFADGMRTRQNPWSLFDVLARTDMLVHYPACSALMIRGDLKRLPKDFRWGATKELAIAMFGIRNRIDSGYYDFNCSSLTPPEANPFFYRTGIDFSGLGATEGNWYETPQKAPLTNDCGVVWDRSIPGKAYLAVAAPKTRLFTGFPEGRTIRLGDVSLAVKGNSLDWATVSLVSQNGLSFDESGARILLAASVRAENTDAKLRYSEDKTRLTYASRGKAPILAEGVTATLEWSVPSSRLTCRGLGERGEVICEVPVAASADGRAVFTISPVYQTVWYEISIK